MVANYTNKSRFLWVALVRGFPINQKRFYIPKILGINESNEVLVCDVVGKAIFIMLVILITYPNVLSYSFVST